MQGRRVPVVFHYSGSIIGGDPNVAGRREERGRKIKVEPLTKYHQTALFGSVEIVKGGV
jgi:hypothetical protein